jgi:hypothetical protein
VSEISAENFHLGKLKISIKNNFLTDNDDTFGSNRRMDSMDDEGEFEES